MRKIVAAVFAALVLTLVCPGVAHAAETTVDQGSMTTTTPFYGTEIIGQTFRAGLTGDLSHVALVVAPCATRGCLAPASAQMSLRAIAGTDPDPFTGDVLASQQVTMTASTSEFGTWTEFVFATPVSVVAGQQYALDFSNFSDGNTGFMGGTDSYTLGHYFSASRPFDTTSDLAFLTYVAVAGGPPMAPDAPTVSSNDPTRVVVSWPEVDGALQYNVLRGESADGPFDWVASVYESTVTLSGHAPGKTYFYAVFAENESGASSWSPATAYTAPLPAHSRRGAPAR